MVHVPIRLVPSVLVAKTFTVPTETAVTRPDELIVAIDVLFDVHSSVLLVAFDGTIAADNCTVVPGTRLADLGSNDTPDIKMGFADTDTDTV